MTSAHGIRRAIACAAIGLLAGFGLASAAVASSFQVSPIKLTVPHGRPVGALTVTNGSPEPVSVRVVTYRWSLRDGVDHYEPTSDLVASPPIFTLKGAGSQLIRVGLRADRGDGEAAYRVILEEIPPQAEPSDGVKIALRLNLPFYKQPKRDGQPVVRWSVHGAGGAGAVIAADNTGPVHEQVNRIDWIDAAGTRATLVDRPSVILAGGQRRWTLPTLPEGAGGNLRLVLVRPTGEEEQTAFRSEDRLPIRIDLGDGEGHAAVARDLP